MGRLALLAALLAHCPAPSGAASEGSATSGSSSAGGTAGSSSGDTTTTVADNSTTDDPIECDVFGGECPAGEKCLPWAPSPAEPYAGTHCVPAGERGPGEACTVQEHPMSGLDDCVAQAVCWFVDPATLQGECVRLCDSDTVDPGCDLPCDALCTIGSELAPPLCLPPCNPLTQDCEAGFTCVAADTHFVCVLDRSGDGGAIGTSCSGVDSCDPGLFCLSALAWPDCEGPGGCCAPACTLDDPEACADAPAEVQCVPWYGGGNAPQSTMCTPFDQIGVCALP